jgi:hypothetical protein
MTLDTGILPARGSRRRRAHFRCRGGIAETRAAVIFRGFGRSRSSGAIMRRLILAVLCGMSVAVCSAAEVASCRWQGTIEIPGSALDVIVDLAQDAPNAWSGSLIAPGLGLKGVPLSEIAIKGDSAAFAMQRGFGRTPDEKAQFDARVEGDAMSGEFHQAGHSATFALRKTGPAQVEQPPRSTAIAKEIEGRWVGEYELGGYTRHVTITLANRTGAPATAEFVVVGKRTTNLPVDLITQDEGLLRIESEAFGINFEGRFRKESGDIKGTFEQGPVELPLTLRRPG